MQQAVLIKKPCQRAHQRGQEEIVSVCLNKDCQNRLSCVNCQREGCHKDHMADLFHFDFLSLPLEKEFAEYRSAGILTLITQRKKEFKEAKAEIWKVIELLEGEFLNMIQRISEADRLVSESINMVETKEFLLFKEAHAQVLVDLKANSLIGKFLKLAEAPIIKELQSLSLSLKSKLQSTQIDEFLKKHCQDALQVERFQQNRLDYGADILVERKLIIEGQIQVQNEANSFYFGGFQDNLKHGRGILVNEDSQEISEGVWENNIMKWGLQMGKLNLINVNFVYIGSFRNSKKEGKGIEKYSNGDSYEGDWKNGKKEGKGIEKFSDGDSYEGDWKNGNKEGKGIEKYSNGDSYEGDWKNGNKEGKGIYKSSDGDSYEGDWKNGNKEGKGIYKSSDGDSYEGDYKNGQREGKGIEKYSSGASYEGDYKNGQREGKGIEKYSSGASYEGDYKNGNKEGKGIYKYSNGDSEEGEYNKNLSIGEHKVYKPTSTEPFKINIYGEQGQVIKVKWLK